MTQVNNDLTMLKKLCDVLVSGELKPLLTGAKLSQLDEQNVFLLAIWKLVITWLSVGCMVDISTLSTLRWLYKPKYTSLKSATL